MLKIEHPLTCLATMAYVHAAYVCRTCFYFSTGSKFQPDSNFTELHALTLAHLFLCNLVELVEDLVIETKRKNCKQLQNWFPDQKAYLHTAKLKV